MHEKNHSIIFVEESHTYLVNGVLTPSVTTILKETIFKDKYTDIPQFVLQKAAQFGQAVHKAIETHDISGLNDNHLQRVVDYVKLVKSAKINELEHEVLLHHDYDYAGTCDLIIEIDGKKAIADIKTTSKFDRSYLSWQMSMYMYALGMDCELYGVWLPSKRYGNPKIEKVERIPKEEIERVLKEYKKEIANERD